MKQEGEEIVFDMRQKSIKGVHTNSGERQLRGGGETRQQLWETF